jgi:hypothetical protein
VVVVVRIDIRMVQVVIVQQLQWAVMEHWLLRVMVVVAIRQQVVAMVQQGEAGTVLAKMAIMLQEVRLPVVQVAHNHRVMVMEVLVVVVQVIEQVVVVVVGQAVIAVDIAVVITQEVEQVPIGLAV